MNFKMSRQMCGKLHEAKESALFDVGMNVKEVSSWSKTKIQNKRKLSDFILLQTNTKENF